MISSGAKMLASLGYSDKEISMDSGIERSTVSRIRTCKREPTLAQAVILSQLYAIPVVSWAYCTTFLEVKAMELEMYSIRIRQSEISQELERDGTAS
jgi:transcriptional regulator with XRE-family HTH domain